MFDVCVIGHVVRDINTIEGCEQEPSPGGTAYYSAMVYASLGLRTAVVTKVARGDEDDLLGELREAGVEIFNLPTERSTVFRNVYNPENPDMRRQQVDVRTGTIRAEEMPKVAASVYHLGPLIRGDIDLGIIRRLVGNETTIALDVQGLTRDIVAGEVVPTRRPGSGDFLHDVDILQADDSEILTFTGASSVAMGAAQARADGAEVVLVTRASHGSLVCNALGMLNVEPVPPRRRLDATGCGDTYLAAFISRWVRDETLSDCAHFASVAAGLNIEHLGPYRGSEEDVFDRWAEFNRSAEGTAFPVPRQSIL